MNAALVSHVQGIDCLNSWSHTSATRLHHGREYFRLFIYEGGAPASVRTCRYSTVYEMTLPGGQNYYECSREAVNGSEYCVLHDSSYHDRGDADMIFGALMEEIDRSRPLVGFHLLAISFVGSKFTEPLYFERCKFYGLVNFSSTDMSAPLIFSNCDFAVGANFSRAKFHCRLLFKAVRSDLAAQFDFAESFFTNIQLVGSVFGMSNFDFAELLRGKFIDSKFMGEVSWPDSKLTNCNFLRISFEKYAQFNTTKFSGCLFDNIQFNEGATFESLVFDANKRSILNINMSYVSLLGADISGVKFSDRTQWNEDYCYSTHDVRMFHADPRPDKFVSTLGVLRSLRDNYEYHLMYHDAGQFFVQEMELRRKYFLGEGNLSTHSHFHRIFSLTGLYCWVCGYGESFRRVGTWLALLFGVSLAYFTLLDVPPPESDATYSSLGMLEKLGLHLKRTLAAFFPLGGGDLSDYVVRATSIPLLGTAFIVIRRRFERKLRH